MPCRRWQVSALRQLQRRDSKSGFSREICLEQDCRPMVQKHVMSSSLLRHCPTISSVVFFLGGCLQYDHEATSNMCGYLLEFIRATWPKYAMQTSRQYPVWVTDLSRRLCCGCGLFLCSPIFSLPLTSQRHAVTVCSLPSESKFQRCAADWTNYMINQDFRVLLMSLAFHILSRFRATREATPSHYNYNMSYRRIQSWPFISRHSAALLIRNLLLLLSVTINGKLS